jgi:hypothetical protein
MLRTGVSCKLDVARWRSEYLLLAAAGTASSLPMDHLLRITINTDLLCVKLCDH